MSGPFKSLLAHMNIIDSLGNANGLLSWDMQTYMPSKGAAARAKTMANLSALSHQLLTEAKVGDWIKAAKQEDLNDFEQACLREIEHRYNEAVKVPERLVRALSEKSSEAHLIWVKAKENNDFKSFAPILSELVQLSREQAEALGFEGSRYNALLDIYERGLTVNTLDPLFDSIKFRLIPLLKAIQNSPHQADMRILKQSASEESQKAFNELVIKAMGFDLEAGRIDTAPHPFCSGSDPTDVRLTNRYLKGEWLSSLFSAMHEAGHGLYEQGIDKKYSGTPLAGGVSLGIHESQSRLWENLVGRSEAFWKYFYPKLQTIFPDQTKDQDFSVFYRAINHVAPSFIRVEADEVTYNLHILLRYEIEKSLIDGDLEVSDLQTVWNDKFSSYFGLMPPSDSEGCLQDIHWAYASFGYFPTYSLGNLYSQQFFTHAEKSIGPLDKQFKAGDFSSLRTWLKDKIHQHGSRYLPEELCSRVTGEALNPDYFLDYLDSKYSKLYDLS